MMGIFTHTCWKSDLDPDKIFKTFEEAHEYERVMIPRQAVSAVLSHEGRIDHDDDAVIDKIVARLGALWSVRGYEQPDVTKES